MTQFPAIDVTSADIEKVFNACFSLSHHTVLQGGQDEPCYCPGTATGEPDRICYRADYVSSSLHEIAHWLVAGEARRRLPDWGYWYAPDGRDQAQQRLFEQVEVKPQAIEWLLHRACGLPFRVSLDNLGGEAGDGLAFREAVFNEARRLLQEGITERTARCYAALASAFGGVPDWRQLVLHRGELDT